MTAQNLALTAEERQELAIWAAALEMLQEGGPLPAPTLSDFVPGHWSDFDSWADYVATFNEAEHLDSYRCDGLRLSALRKILAATEEET